MTKKKLEDYLQRGNLPPTRRKAAWLFFFCSVGYIREEDQLVVQSCEAFNFGIQETNWILFPQGKAYSFKSGDKIIEIATEYRISEPYTLEYERRPIFSLFPDGQVRNCFSYFESNHNTENRSLSINNSIGYVNPKENIFMNVSFDRMSFELKVLNDTLTGARTSFHRENFEEYLFMNFNSVSLGGKQYNQVLRISQFHPNVQPKEIYLAKRLGLVAFVKNDSLWIRD